MLLAGPLDTWMRLNMRAPGRKIAVNRACVITMYNALVEHLKHKSVIAFISPGPVVRDEVAPQAYLEVLISTKNVVKAGDVVLVVAVCEILGPHAMVAGFRSIR